MGGGARHYWVGLIGKLCFLWIMNNEKTYPLQLRPLQCKIFVFCLPFDFTAVKMIKNRNNIGKIIRFQKYSIRFEPKQITFISFLPMQWITVNVGLSQAQYIPTFGIQYYLNKRKVLFKTATRTTRNELFKKKKTSRQFLGLLGW